MRAGLSEAFARPDDAAAAIDQARLALAVALGAPRTATPWSAHAALDPASRCSAPPRPSRPRAAARARSRRSRPSRACGRRSVAYLDAGLDLGRAAHALGLHRNSLRYRLDRAELALGRSLRDTGTVATLHLALLAERLDPLRINLAGDRARAAGPGPTGEPDPIRLDSPGRDA